MAAEDVRMGSRSNWRGPESPTSTVKGTFTPPRIKSTASIIRAEPARCWSGGHRQTLKLCPRCKFSTFRVGSFAFLRCTKFRAVVGFAGLSPPQVVLAHLDICAAPLLPFLNHNNPTERIHAISSCLVGKRRKPAAPEYMIWATCPGANTHHAVRIHLIDAGIGKNSHQRDSYTSGSGNPHVNAASRANHGKGRFAVLLWTLGFEKKITRFKA